MHSRFRFASALSVLTFSGSGIAQEVPPTGASVTVRFDTHKIREIDARGLADPFTKRPVTADDTVRIASVSKLVVALGVMRMVDAGTLDLDRDVSVWLGWRLRNPAYPDTPITLRLLLSHQSSVTDGIDYALPLGVTLKEAMTNPAAWDAIHKPGAYFHYTNLNFPIVASVMEAASGDRFDRLMARLVFTPLDIDACFNWTTCSDVAVSHAVVLTNPDRTVRKDRLDGKRPPCPVVADASGGCDLSRYVPGTNGALFSPQGGMRISARDLARIGQMLAQRGRGFLSAASFKTMVRPLWKFDGSNGETDKGLICGYGLAVQTLAIRQDGCRDDMFGDGRHRIGHGGDAYGLKSGVWIDPKSGKGIAFFITAIQDDAPKGRSAATAAEEAALQGSPSPPRR